MIEHIFIIALCTLGYCCVFWEGMIFQSIGDFMECNTPQWLWKPLGGCYICACMWIGSIVYAVLYGLPNTRASVVEWFITCIGAMGVNAAISQFVDKHHKVDITDLPSGGLIRERWEIHPDDHTKVTKVTFNKDEDL